jgi:DNA-binding MarR family transcriptional regulator
MSDHLVSMLDRIAVGSVAITARAIAGAGADLTFVQWRVIFVVGEAETGATVTEIAQRTGAKASPTSRLVARLARRGFLRSSREDADGRVTRVRLTESGRDLRERILDLRRGVLSDIALAADLGPSGTEQLRRLAGAFGAYA